MPVTIPIHLELFDLWFLHVIVLINIIMSKKVKKYNQNARINNVSLISVARIFDWGGPKPQITWMTSSEIFKKGTLLWGKDIVEWKIWSRSQLETYPGFW